MQKDKIQANKVHCYRLNYFTAADFAHKRFAAIEVVPTVAHKCTPNSKRHSKFVNTFPILLTHSQLQKLTPNSKHSLRILKTHSECQTFTPNSKNSLRIPKLHSEF